MDFESKGVIPSKSIAEQNALKMKQLIEDTCQRLRIPLSFFWGLHSKATKIGVTDTNSKHSCDNGDSSNPKEVVPNIINSNGPGLQGGGANFKLVEFSTPVVVIAGIFMVSATLGEFCYPKHKILVGAIACVPPILALVITGLGSNAPV